MEEKPLNFETYFNIDKVSFDNVSREFEDKFRDSYKKSLQKMSDNRNALQNASGGNSLGILENMARNISRYDEHSDFDQSFREMLGTYERFTET